MIFCSSCVNVKPVDTRFTRYEVKEVNFVSATFDFIFNVDNPNDIPLNVKKIEYNLYLEEKSFVKGESKGFDLGAKENKEISIPVKLSYLDTIDSLATVVKNLLLGSKKVAYRFEGDLVVESLGASAKVPLRSQGELSLSK